MSDEDIDIEGFDDNTENDLLYNLKLNLKNNENENVNIKKNVASNK